MFRLGERQTLMYVKKTDFGIYLGSEKEKILLPKKQVPNYLEVGDPIDVFVYRDSSDRLIATTKEPYINLGQVQSLEVKEVGKIGAFLDWGLEKDLLLPYKEQTCHVKPGKEYLVALYIDKSNRLAATMRIHRYLQNTTAYGKDDIVHGTIYEIGDETGAFVAVDDAYHGMIPRKEIHEKLYVGQKITARVSEVREDGKLNLSIKKRAFEQMDEDAAKVLRVIEALGGTLDYNDKASPDIIAKDFEMSKAAFKRAVGRLYKNGRVDIGENCITIKNVSGSDNH